MSAVTKSPSVWTLESRSPWQSSSVGVYIRPGFLTLPGTFSGPKGASYRPEMKASPCLVTNIFRGGNDTRKVLDKKRMQNLLVQMQNSDSGETAPSV